MRKILSSTRSLLVFILIAAMPVSYFLLEELLITLIVIATLLSLLIAFAILVKVSKNKEKKRLTRPSAGYMSTKAKVIAKTEFEKNICSVTFAFDYQGKNVETKVIIEGCKKQIDTYLREGNNAKIFVNPADPNDVIIPQLAYKQRKQNDDGLFWRLFEGFFKYIVPLGVAASIIIPLYFTFKDNFKDKFSRDEKEPDFRFESLCYFRGNTETIWELYSDETSKYRLVVKNPYSKIPIAEITQTYDKLPSNMHIMAQKDKIWVVAAERFKMPVIDAYNPYSYQREICDTVFLNMYPEIQGVPTDSYYPKTLNYYENGRASSDLKSIYDKNIISFETSEGKEYFYVFSTKRLFNNEEELYWYLCLDRYTSLNSFHRHYLFYDNNKDTSHLYKSTGASVLFNKYPIDKHWDDPYFNPYLRGNLTQMINTPFNKASIIFEKGNVVCVKHINRNNTDVISVFENEKLLADIDLSKCANYKLLNGANDVFTLQKHDTLFFRSKHLGEIHFHLSTGKTRYSAEELLPFQPRKRMFHLKYDASHENNELYVFNMNLTSDNANRIDVAQRLKNAQIVYQNDDIALLAFQTSKKDVFEYNFVCVHYNGKTLYNLTGDDIARVKSVLISPESYLQNHLTINLAGNYLVMVFDDWGVICFHAISGKKLWFSGVD